MSSPWSTGNRSSSPLLGGSPYGMSPVQLNSSCPEASYLSCPEEAILAEELSTPFVERTTSNIDCAVCQEHFQDGENVRRLPCNHQFHTACVDPWLQMHARCPLCNSQMPGTVPMPPRNLNPTFSSTTASAAARQRPPRERIGRRKKRVAQRNADLVTGAWLNNIMGGLSLLDDEGDDGDDHFAARKNKTPFFAALEGNDADDIPLGASKRSDLTATAAKRSGVLKIDSSAERREETFHRHWIKIQKKIRSDLKREYKRSRQNNSLLWNFVNAFESYVVALSRDRRHGPIRVLPPTTEHMNLMQHMHAEPCLENALEGTVAQKEVTSGLEEEDWRGVGPTVPAESKHEGATEGRATEGRATEGRATQGRAQKKVKKIKRPKQPPIVLHLKSGAHRLLAHGVCQFYGFHCKSQTMHGTRVFRVLKCKKYSNRDNHHQVSLFNDLGCYLMDGRTSGHREIQWGVEEQFVLGAGGSKKGVTEEEKQQEQEESFFAMDL